jgi:branched-chain amino acid transport system ATP-binding protein
MSALILEHVYKDFSGLEVLMDISMEVKKGERHAVIGPNGAGKSTLFNIITGRYKPSRGIIRLMGRDVTGFSVHRIARMGLSRSFQVINNFPKMTVFENVRNAVVSKVNLRFNVVSCLARSRKIQKETGQILKKLGMEQVMGVPAAELSYGWQRKLELALTLALDPDIVMLDEPTAGLDVEETKGFVQLVKTLTEGKTLVVVEHDMDVVFTLADRITVLNYGGLLITGSPEEVRSSEAVRNAYLGRDSSAAGSE